MINLHKSAPYVFNLNVNLDRVACIISFRLPIIPKILQEQKFLWSNEKMVFSPGFFTMLLFTIAVAALKLLLLNKIYL